MTYSLLPRVALLWTLCITPFPALAAGPQRIPLGLPGAAEIPKLNSSLFRLGDTIYFLAEDPVFGNELWGTDGTGEGTRRLTDHCPGDCSTLSFVGFAAIGNRVFFAVNEDGRHLLYRLEGDTVSLVAYFPGRLDQMVAFDGQLLLLVSRPTGKTIFATSGESSDLRVFDILCTPGSTCEYGGIQDAQDAIFYLKGGFLRRAGRGGELEDLLPLYRFEMVATLAGGRFVFWGCSRDPWGCSVYASGGSPSNTVVLSTSLQVGSTFATLNGAIYWVQNERLVRSDGTVAGTTPLAVLADRVIGATATHVFFVQSPNGFPDRSLYSLSNDGALAELHTFSYADPEVVGALGDAIFLAYRGQTLHVSDGTVAGTRKIEDLVVPVVSTTGQVLGDRLYATAYRLSSPLYAGGLWSFDKEGNASPLPTTTVLAGTFATPLALGGGSLAAFAGGDPLRLWRIDPQTLAPDAVAGPELVPLIGAGGRLLARTVASPRGYYVVSATGLEPLPIEGGFSFAAGEEGTFYWGQDEPGQKLWASDGTAAGTRELHDFSPGWAQTPGCSRHCRADHPSGLTVQGDLIYLVADAEPGSFEVAVWAYHRGRGEATRLKIFGETPYTEPVKFFPVAGKMVFVLDLPDEDGGLWVTDGTPSGTRKIVGSERGIERFSFLGAVGEQLFFVDYLRNQLWVTDLTVAGTRVLVDQPDFRPAYDRAAVVGDHLFFAASTYDLGDELWVSDGTAAGTRALDLRPGPLGSRPSSPLAMNGRVIFGADRGDRGHELYESDGTLEGTFLLADLDPGSAPSSPDHLLAVGGRLFFTANDGAGRDLFAFDPPPPSRPSCPADRLCLRDGRFEVRVSVENSASGAGSRVLSSAESGVLSFFAPNNWELLVKVLDGCAINGRFWVYSAGATDVPFVLEVTDRASGTRRSYRHPGGGAAAPALDADAFATCGLPAPPSAYAAVLPLAPSAPRCGDDLQALCLGAGERFRATVAWQTAGAAGAASPAAFGSADSGLFTFFSPANWELMVKVLDGCAINGHHWVYVAATSDVGWRLTVEDRLTGASRTYDNAPGPTRTAITDGAAFPGCP